MTQSVANETGRKHPHGDKHGHDHADDACCTFTSKATSEPAKPWWPLALAGAAAIASEAITWTAQPEWLAALLAIAAVAACGLTTYKKGWVAIRNGNLNINALMSIAVTGALLLQQ